MACNVTQIKVCTKKFQGNKNANVLFFPKLPTSGIARVSTVSAQAQLQGRS